MKSYGQYGVTSLVMVLSLITSGCQSNGQRVFDEDFLTSITGDVEPTELTLQIKRALKRNGQTAIHNIQVILVSEGSIKLTGVVPDSATMHEAERVAYSVDGVRIVANSLYIQ